MKLAQQTILITGASSGIGAELARQLADRGCRLLLTARRGALLDELIAGLPGGSQRHCAFSCDLSCPEEVESLCRTILGEHAQLDGMILNAGVGGGFNAAAIDVAGLRYQFEVNFWGAVGFIARLSPLLLERRQGFIAVTSSLAGYRGLPAAAAYSASKAALTRFIESMRIDCRRSGVHFAVISPGFVRTPMTERGEGLRPFMIDVPRAAAIIIRGLERRRYEIRFPWLMVLLVRFGLILPEGLYMKLLAGRRKPQPTPGAGI